MSANLILVSQRTSDKLWKSLPSHIENNPLIMTQFDMKTGSRIYTSIGTNLSALIPTDRASYYFIRDLSVHEQSKLDPEDITAFLLANSDRCLNTISLRGSVPEPSDMGVILFEFILRNATGRNVASKVIDTFP
jgi:hypothetical protein